jgi:hypothetical protein
MKRETMSHSRENRGERYLQEGVHQKETDEERENTSVLRQICEKAI